MNDLGSVSNGRANNLNLIRLLAAGAVLVSHAWPITQGPGAVEPLQAETGRTLGTHAVMIFFALSGFLIAASYACAPDPARFVARRARRILPGLIAALVLTAAVMGPLVTDLTLGAYAGHPETWRFLIRNSTMVGLEPDLPGVFAANPYPAAAGSIWTLSYEVACYAGVLGLGLTLGIRRWPVLLVVCVVAALGVAAEGADMHPRLEHLLGLGLPFCIGMACYAWRDRIPLSVPVLALVLGVALVASGTALADTALAGATAYGVLMAGFWPPAQVQLGRGGADYSYGLYIYAFPVQGLAVHLFGPMSPWVNIAVALPASLMLAALSWHLIERPWLHPRSRVAPARTPAHQGAA